MISHRVLVATVLLLCTGAALAGKRSNLYRVEQKVNGFWVQSDYPTYEGLIFCGQKHNTHYPASILKPSEWPDTYRLVMISQAHKQKRKCTARTTCDNWTFYTKLIDDKGANMIYTATSCNEL